MPHSCYFCIKNALKPASKHLLLKKFFRGPPKQGKEKRKIYGRKGEKALGKVRTGRGERRERGGEGRAEQERGGEGPHWDPLQFDKNRLWAYSLHNDITRCPRSPVRDLDFVTRMSLV